MEDNTVKEVLDTELEVSGQSDETKTIADELAVKEEIKEEVKEEVKEETIEDVKEESKDLGTELDKARKDLEEREQAFNKRVYDAELDKLIEAQGVPVSFKEFIKGNELDIDKAKGRVEEAKRVFEEALSERLKEALKGESPKDSSGVVKETYNMANDFAKYL